MTSSLEGGGFDANPGMPHEDPGTGTFIYEDADPDGDSPVTPDPDFKYEYDDQYNPMYHLPWIASGKLQALPFPGMVASPTYLYLFDAEAFFNPTIRSSNTLKADRLGICPLTPIHTIAWDSQSPADRPQASGPVCWKR